MTVSPIPMWHCGLGRAARLHLHLRATSFSSTFSIGKAGMDSSAELPELSSFKKSPSEVDVLLWDITLVLHYPRVR